MFGSHAGIVRGGAAAADTQEAERAWLDYHLYEFTGPTGRCGPTCACQLAGPDVDDPLAIVVITTFDLDEYVHGALKAGARGFLLKDAGPAMLTQAIHAAAAGDALIAPSITVRLLAAFADNRRGPATGTAR